MSAPTIPVHLLASVVRAAALQAQHRGMSIEAWIERAVIDRLDTDEGAAEFFRRRAQGATGDGLSALLALAPHAPPMPGDELPEGWSASEAGLGAR